MYTVHHPHQRPRTIQIHTSIGNVQDLDSD